MNKKHKLDVSTKNTASSSKAWLSNGVEQLFERKGLNKYGKPFDVIIIGSGYGGAIAARELSKASKLGLSICLLERGREFLPGSFPTSMDEAPTEFRMSSGAKPSGNLEGLFDLRLSEDLNVMQANGLGGGSLINAGVMARAHDHVFDNNHWPSELSAAELEPFYTDAEYLLGATVSDKQGNTVGNTILLHEKYLKEQNGPDKYQSLKQLAQAGQSSNFKAANITVNMTDGALTSAGYALNACKLCGDCASGCNVNAKNSLDKNLLIEAAQNGVEIFTGASVLALSKKKKQWQVDVVYTDHQLRLRQSQAQLELLTDNVILSAGALGSTEILQRSQSKELVFSDQLGKQFSSNGDMLAVGFKQNQRANAIADSSTVLSSREIGPTITGMIDLRDNTEADSQVVIQEMAVPGAAAHFFSELYATVNSIQTLWNGDFSDHEAGSNFVDQAALNQFDIQNTSLYAVMGNDGANGTLKLKRDNGKQYEGSIRIEWPELKQHNLFEQQIKQLKYLSSTGDKAVGGQIIANPMWQILKPEHMQMLTIERGAPLTVHPLGGCPMGNSYKDGVTNHLGQVFKYKADGDSKAVYKGLVVLDGSMIPEAVGINPALTISAVSLRAIRQLIELKQLNSTSESSSNKEKHTEPVDLGNSPIIRSLSELEALSKQHQRDTEIQVTERLVGYSKLEDERGVEQDVVIELSLWSKPVKVNALNKANNAGKPSRSTVEIDSELYDPVSKLPLSKVRVYLAKDWDDIRAGKTRLDKHELALDNAAKFIGQIEGELHAFSRADSSPSTRILSSGWGWLLNRGMRDIYQSKRPKPWDRSANQPKSNLAKPNIFTRFVNLAKTLSRAGEIRTMNYDVTICKSLKSTDFSYFGPNTASTSNDKTNVAKKIIGIKRITYKRRANPWLQLSQVHLQELPNKSNTSISNKLSLNQSESETKRLTKQLKRQERKLNTKGNILSLDMNYLTRVGIPLVRISEQQNQLKALMDLSSLGTYITRMLLGVHFYSFRAPDAPKHQKIERFADQETGLPKPTVHHINVGSIPDNKIPSLSAGAPVEIVLTHYAAKLSSKHKLKPPVMMVHGYSGSSAFFAHKSTPHNLSRTLHEDGHDVWLLDLRTSAALPSARYPWSFESVADYDIPQALDFIYQHYHAKKKINLVTHCMGSVMLGMSILKPHKSNNELEANFFRDRVNSILFSQATPTVVFTQDNNFRSFATSYFREFIPDDYQFQVRDDEGEGASQILDRVLYTLPYPKTEFDITNVPSKPFVRAEFARTRHRVDALFARTFELANLHKDTLNHIDDIFGPIHVDTIVQASRFANHNVATNANGNNMYVSKERLQECWQGIPTMSLHSRNNGLVDFSTGARTKLVFDEAGIDYTYTVLENQSYGHQDSIIGQNSHVDVFPHILEFLNKDKAAFEQSKPVNDNDVSIDKASWVIKPPTHGPILIEPTQPRRAGSDKLTVAIGPSVARASKPICVFLPVIEHEGRLELASDDDGLIQKAVACSLALNIKSAHDSEAPWSIVEISDEIRALADMRTAEHTSELAVLMIYNDLAELGDLPVIGPMGDQSFYHAALTRSKTDYNVEVNDLPNLLTSAIQSFLASNRNVAHEFSKAFVQIPNIENNSINSKQAKSTDSSSLNFVLGSCQYPAGMLDKEVAYRSYQYLDQALESDDSNKPEFVALVGDQIYADATAGFLDPSTKFDQFVMPYYRLFENKHVRNVLRKLPLYAMLDDHELVDNWEPLSNNPEQQKVLDETLAIGVKSFLKFQRGQLLDERNDLLGEKAMQLWYTFERKGHSFFMSDTRTERCARTAENIAHPDTRIMSLEQENAINLWLDEQTQKQGNTKFLLSSSIFLPRHKPAHASTGSLANSIRSDGWDGYPASLYSILAQVVNKQVQNLVFLSGDEHQACFAKIDIVNLNTKAEVTAHSLHCPGLYTPFPFANGRSDGFEGHCDASSNIKVSEFSFTLDGQDYHCRIEANLDLETLPLQLGPVSVDNCGGFIRINTDIKH